MQGSLVPPGVTLRLLLPDVVAPVSAYIGCWTVVILTIRRRCFVGFKDVTDGRAVFTRRVPPISTVNDTNSISVAFCGLWQCGVSPLAFTLISDLYFDFDLYFDL